MNPRTISYISILLASLTGIWVISMIALIRHHGVGIDNYEDALRFVTQRGTLFFITYLNVVLLTIVDVILFGLLYVWFRKEYPAGSLIGILFVPIYASYNLFVYISQVSVVQKIIDLYEADVEREVLEVFLGQMIQIWDKSAMAFANNFAYAILGIPSLLFGIMIYRMNLAGRITGVLLIISAIACLLGIAGIIAGNDLLSTGSSIGGVFFLLSLIGMSATFWRN